VARSDRERVTAYLEWADRMAGGVNPSHRLFDHGRPLITAVWYADCPSSGWGCGLTYGASLCPDSRLELLVVVRSTDPRWIWAVAHFVDVNRNRISGMSIGDTINWHEPVANDSTMDAFVITGAAGLPPGEDVVHLAEDDHIQILQAVPAYASEFSFVRNEGVASWVRRVGDNLHHPGRPPLFDTP
jgi:Suppressor of fused protein (SUFU)